MSQPLSASGFTRDTDEWGKRPRWTHGTATAYNHYGCRCDICRAWCREKARRYRARKRAA